MGPWGRNDFARTAGSGGAATLAREVADVHGEAWEFVADRGDQSRAMVYMFTCSACGSLRGHWDID